jgi:hypothetical protein
MTRQDALNAPKRKIAEAARTRSAARHRWTKRQDGLLGTMPDERLARKLRRSVEAVRGRRHLKRISIRRQWQPEEDKILGTRSDEDIATLLGREVSTVTLHRRRLGVAPFRDKDVDGMDRKLAAMTDRQIARLLRKSYCLRKPAASRPKHAPKWSAREDELLGKWPDDRLARFLGRTKKAVEGRRQKLRILYSTPSRRWTKEEVRQLDRALVRGPIKTWTAQLARRLGRTVTALKAKRRLAYGATVLMRRWTKPELRLLGTMTDREVAAVVGRSSVNVQVKRCALGIRSFRERNKPRWTPSRDRLLGTRSDAALGKRFGMPRHAVEARRHELGISSLVYRNWTRKEELLVGTMRDKEVARRIGRSRKAVEHRRRALNLPSPRSQAEE